MRARTHEIVAIDACPLFALGLEGAVAAARALAADLRGLGKPLDISVTATLEGLDVDLRGSGPLGLAETRKLVRTAEALDLARIANHGLALVERRPVRVAFGEALVALPPGGFLQATEAGEAPSRRSPSRRFSGAKKVADLFCGAGAFALRLAGFSECSQPTPTPPPSARWRGARRKRRASSRSRSRRAILSAGRSPQPSWPPSTARSSIRPGRAPRPRRGACREQRSGRRRDLVQPHDLRPRRHAS